MFFDISLPLSSELPVWPGDPALSLKRTVSLEEAGNCNVTEIQMGVHTGTHIDAPFHFFQDGMTVDRIPLTTLIGPCSVMEIETRDRITEAHLRELNFDGVSRVLFKTGNSDLWRRSPKVFDQGFIGLSSDAARFLCEKDIILIGIDYLSIEPYGSNGNPVHKTLLKKQVAILEGLNLSGIDAGTYELMCLPLKVVGCDGAPARAVLYRP